MPSEVLFPGPYGRGGGGPGGPEGPEGPGGGWLNKIAFWAAAHHDVCLRR
jgi:hypothetical protein